MLVYRTAEGYGLSKGKYNKTWKSWKDCIRSLLIEDRSFCDHCGRRLNWYENIPVISWMVLGGRTMCCRKKLNWSYPLVELLTGVLLVLFYLVYPNLGWQMIGGWIMITLLVFSAVFDLKYMILPDYSTVILIIISLIGVILGGKEIIPYLLSALGAAGFLLFLHILTKGKGMGMGDVKLAVFMGLMLGWPQVVIAFYVAFISGALVGGVMLVSKKMKRNSLISFGPFLILGTMVAWWWGENLYKLIIYNF
jgi:leader peptidase (prepilin peptidase) / N-methyltransferase